MKTLSLIALLALTTTSAFATFGNDGPSAQPKPKREALLAEAVQACGFMCPNQDVKGVRIYDNGVVESYRSSRVEKEKKTLLAQLEPEVVRKLKAIVEEMPNEELVDQDEGKPECMDAATTTYLVQKFVGTRVKIAQNYGCHEHLLPYDQGKEIRYLLASMFNLSN